MKISVELMFLTVVLIGEHSITLYWLLSYGYLVKVKVKVKLSLRLSKHHAIKTYGEVEV